ncbi:MAG: hypothetical protein ACRCYB_13505 [Aeromonas veronii]
MQTNFVDMPYIQQEYRRLMKVMSVACVGFILSGCPGQAAEGLSNTPSNAASQAQTPISPKRPKPPGWDGDNVLLGSWYSDSTAGAAVLDRVTLTGDRIRWGNKANGICDSEYNVEWVAAEEGTYPDSLSPPEPGVTYMVARLTLIPKPCATGDAMLQLAYPMGGQRSVYANLYGADGKMTGWFGVLLPVEDSEPETPTGH